MDISLARTVGFVLGERKPLPFLYIRTLSMVPSVSVLLEYGFCTPTMNSQEYPPGHHSNDVSGFELFTLGKKGY